MLVILLNEFHLFENENKPVGMYTLHGKPLIRVIALALNYWFLLVSRSM